MLRAKLRRVLMVVMAFIMLVGMAACGNNTSTDKEQSSAASTAATSTTAATATGDDQKPVTLKLVMNSNQASVDATKNFSNKFTAKYPNITVDVQASSTENQVIMTRAAAGDLDLFIQFGFVGAATEWAKGAEKPVWQQLADQGMMEDLTNQPFIKNFNPEAIKNASTYNGKVYGMPMGTVGTYVIYYNKDIFEQNGLSIPETYDEFINVCKTLQSKGIAPMTLGAKDGWPYTLLVEAVVGMSEADTAAYGKALYTGERKLNDEGSMKIFERLNEINGYLEKGITGVDYNSVIGRFTSGKAAMLLDGTWQAQNIKKAAADFKFAAFPFPNLTKGSQPPQLGGKYDTQFIAFADSPNKEAALKWMSMLAEKENYTEWVNAVGLIPTQLDVEVKDEFVKSLEPYNKAMKIEWQSYCYTPKGIGKYAASPMFNGMFLKSVGGPVATAKELADLAQKDLETALSAVK